MDTTNKLVFQCFLLIVAFAIISLITVKPIFSDDANPLSRQVVILAEDTNSVVSEESHMQMVDSIIGIMSKTENDDDFYLMPMNSPTDLIGPYRTGDNDFEEFAKLVRNTIQEAESNTSIGVSIDETIGESYNLLDMEGAPPGSGLYLISTNKYPDHKNYIGHKLDPLADLYFGREWHISTFALSGIPESNLEISTKLAGSTSGHIFLLDNINGLKSFTEHLLITNKIGKLIPSGEKKLTFNDLLISDIEVLPGTEYVMAMFFRDNNAGSFRLKNPDGLEASTGDRSSSSVLETPNTVIWIINDPIPGIWNVDVTGISGLVSSWYLSSNKYRLNFQMPEVVPTDEPAIISAFISEAEALSKISLDATVEADVTPPGLSTVSYKLKDDGSDGDSKSGDGYYSASIPAPLSEGKYEVSIQLSWPDVKYSLTRDFTFEAKVFPSITMEPLYTSNLFIGEEYTVATIYTRIKDSPYSILPSSIDAQVINDAQFNGILKLSARSPDAEGKAWMYDVIFSPDKSGQLATAFKAELNYANRTYSRYTENLILESREIPQAPAQNYSYTTPNDVSADSSETINKSKTNMLLVITIAIGVLFIIIIPIVIYRSSLPKPYGFISDESGNSVLIFNQLKNRNPVKSIFLRHVITGAETGISEFAGTNFIFGKGSLLITATGSSHTIRINNQPLVGSAYISDGTWIGATGKLFRFTTEKTYPK